MVSHNVGFAFFQHLEQITVGHHAKALIPWVVTGGKVLHVEGFAHARTGCPQQQTLDRLWAFFAQLKDQALQANVAGTANVVHPGVGHEFFQRHGNWVH